MIDKIKNLTQEQKKNIELIGALIIFVIYMIYSLISNIVVSKKKNEVEYDVALVTDNSRYFTVLNCAQKYLNYVQEKEYNNVYILLEKNYKKQNNISETNVNNFIPNLDQDYEYDYVGEEMYQQRVSKSTIKYNINGKIKKFIYDGDYSYENYNITVVLYEDKMLFAIIPGVSI